MIITVVGLRERERERARDRGRESESWSCISNQNRSFAVGNDGVRLEVCELISNVVTVHSGFLGAAVFSWAELGSFFWPRRAVSIAYVRGML